MRRSFAAAASMLGSVVLVAVLLAGASGPVDAAPTPTPAPSSEIPIAVVIPDIEQSTRAPSNSSGSGSGSGSSTPPALPPSGPDGAPVPPKVPSENAPALELDKLSLSKNDWMTATGTGYTPGEKVQFVLYPGAIVIGSYLADASGKVVARFRIPDDTRPGDHVLEATGWESKRVANGAFTVVTSGSGGAVVPWLWWVLLVLGVLLASLIALAIYYRESIRGFFGGMDAAPEAAP